jgi:diguanylate cyclase (GGDEF)-like protein
MLDTPMSERSWRLDRVDTGVNSSSRIQEVQSSSEACSDSLVRTSGQAQPWSAGTKLPHAARGIFRNWLQAIFARRRGVDRPFEVIIQEFARVIETEVDPVVVESSFLRLVRQLVPASWIELIAEPSLAGSHEGDVDCHGPQSNHSDSVPGDCSMANGQSLLDIPLRCGRSTSGRLRIRPRTGGCLPLRNDVIDRLNTLCTMAACAFDSLGRRPVCPDDDELLLDEMRSTQSARNAGRPSRPSVLCHDATFLNAVLPFALNQAKRHRESLSLLCVATDRLSSIQDLLGRAEVNRLVQHVGQTVGKLIRASDIVARLDDNRIVVVLPRAPRGGALHVAENICQAIAAQPPPGCDSSAITVSIGVATFPSCAPDVYTLLDAADEALSWAQKQGRNRAVLAPTRRGSPKDKAMACSS